MQTGDRSWCAHVASGAFAFGLAPDERALAAMALHAESLLRWNRKINLTAITDPLEVAEKHVLDSLAVVPHLPASGRVLDMGSGGGFPGMIIAVMRPDLDVTMVDSVAKKTAFVREVIRALHLENARVLHGRVESLTGGDLAGDGFDCIVSRAFTALDRFVAFSLPLLGRNGGMLAMKGPEADNEVGKFREAFADLDVYTHRYTLPSGGGDRRILEIRSREAKTRP